ncbi:MAG: CHRD domain-containing protein [Gemmataceae bacterium]
MTRLFGLLALAVVLVGPAATAPAAFQVYVAQLSGPAESPPNASPGIGFAEVDIDPVAHLMRVQVTFSGLIGTTTAAHIHGPTAVPGAGTAGVATTTPTFPGFPSGVTAGSYDRTFDMTLASSYNPAFVTANGGTPASAEAALFAAITQGRAYLNVHTTFAPGGEIRGFLTPAPVPAPSGLLLFATGGVGLIAGLRRRARPAV